MTLTDRRGYCQLKEEALDRTVWSNRSGRGFGPVVWQITDDDDEDDDDDDDDDVHSLQTWPRAAWYNLAGHGAETHGLNSF